MTYVDDMSSRILVTSEVSFPKFTMLKCEQNPLAFLLSLSLED
jgi:hypothetical protein